MKIKNLLLGLIALFLFNACSDEAKTSFEQLTTEFNQIEISQLNLTSLETLVAKIDNHVNKFPEYEQNHILLNFKSKALIAAENKVYEELINSISQIENETFQDYESAIKSYSIIKQNLTEYLNNAQNQQNIQDAQNRIERINVQLNSINLEQNDFYSAVGSNNTYVIEEFLNKYPNSVMRNSLFEKIDEIYYSEFLSDFNSSPSSIYEINSAVSKAKNYLTKFRSLEAKNKINELIVNIESQRRGILEMELQDKLQDLIERMEDAARTRAANAHPTYSVEMCTAHGHPHFFVFFRAGSPEMNSFFITTSRIGLSPGPVLTFPIASTTSIPPVTRPKIACLPSSHGVGASVTKNCEPPVFGPAFAIERIPGLSCRSPSPNSSGIV